MEENGKEGIADLLHRMILMGTETRTKAQLDRVLKSIGAKVKTVDSAFIPFDDYYTVQEYSFVRFQTTYEFYRDGLALLSEILFHPALTNNNLNKARRSLGMIIGIRSKNPRVLSRLELLKLLYPSCWMSKPVYGTFQSVENITLADIRGFHKKYFTPSNMIFTVETNLPAEKILNALEKSMGSWPVSLPKRRKVCKTVPQEKELKKEKTIPLGKTQSYLRAGYLMEVDRKDVGALKVMMSILSDDLSFELRERQGLAYSIGAGIETVGDGSNVMFSAAMGTMPKNISKALKQMKDLIKRFESRSFSQKEVTKTINHIRGRALMRWIPALNRAYFFGLDLFRGREPLSYRAEMEKLKTVSVKDILRVRKKYFAPDKFEWVIVK